MDSRIIESCKKQDRLTYEDMIRIVVRTYRIFGWSESAAREEAEAAVLADYVTQLRK